MMYKLYEKKAFCYSKLKKIILTLKALKISYANAGWVEKLLRSEINFPGLLYNIAQAENSLNFVSPAFKSINNAINKEFGLIDQHKEPRSV